MTNPLSPTAAILIIGNEILSGKTQDANTPFIAQRLAEKGIKLCEVRVVRDEEAEIVLSVKALSKKYTYVFSTGGIGPTHDDITSECMAKAFNVPHVLNAEAKQRMLDYYQKGEDYLNEARLRMAHIPEGAELIDNPVSAAPGFKINNVYVMAGVPKIMQAMFLSIEDKLQGGPPVLSRTVTAALREGDIAADLLMIQNAFPDIEIGSYPHMKDGNPCVSLVLRGQSAERLEAALEKTVVLAKKWKTEPIIS